MDTTSLITVYGTAILFQMPIFLALLAGVITAIVFLVRKVARKSAVLALIGLLIAIVQHLVGPVMTFLPYSVSDQVGMNPTKVALFVSGFNLVNNVVTAIVWVLMILAVFTARKREAAV